VDLAASPLSDDMPPVRVRPDAGLPEQQGPALKEGEEAELVEPGSDPDDLYVRCVPAKGIVTRYGGGSAAYVGARRNPKVEGGIEYLPEAVVLIPGADVRRYAREYTRVFAEGALTKSTRAEYLAYRKKRVEELQAAKADRERKRAEVAAAQDAPQEPTKPSTPVALAASGSEAPSGAADSTSGG